MTTTIIPGAPDTVTDLEAPERETDVLRVGGLVLQAASYQSGLWMRVAQLSSGEAEATLEYDQRDGHFSVELSWCGHNGSRLAVVERHKIAEEALIAARAVGNFAPEFFEALSKEL